MSVDWPTRMQGIIGLIRTQGCRLPNFLGPIPDQAGPAHCVDQEGILRSEEHCLYVFAHETFEIQELKRTFARNKGAITFVSSVT